MARCKGTTRKGTECRLNAMKGSDYCAVHLTQGPAATSGREAIEDREGRLGQAGETALGFALLAGVILRSLIKK